MKSDYRAPTLTFHLPTSLLLGVSAIDSEHDELVRQVDSYLSKPDTEINSERFTDFLSQLGNQLRKHFTNEESYLKTLPMPANEIAGHVEAHTTILQQYTQLNIDLMHGKNLNHGDILLMIKGWIFGHVIQFDRNMKKYLPKTN